MPATNTSSGKRRLLCEGWAEDHVDSSTGLLAESESEDVAEALSASTGEVWFPEVGYVTQAEKLYVLFGESTRLDESIVDGRQVIKSIDEFDQLEERQMPDGRTVRVPKDARWVVEGPAQRSDVENANRRKYPRSIWEKLIADPDSYVQRSIRERGMGGHIEHPKDGRSDLNHYAILTTSSQLREDGTVWNSFELLNNSRGRELQALTADGVRWGVSSRGTGTVKDDGTVSEADYTLKTWDAVAAPSTPGAFVREADRTGLGRQVSETNTETAKAISETTSEILESLGELTETDIDGLDLVDRVKLSENLLRGLSSILETEDISALLLRKEPWMVVQDAVRKLRELHASGSLSIDRAIDEALEHSGEEASEESAWNEIVETLQEQVSVSVTEARSLLEQLEAAESRFVTLNNQHEEALEQLSETREDLARARAELDLAYELLSEATAPKGDGRVDVAVVEGIIDRVPELTRYRSLIEQARDETQALALVERLVPVAVPRAPREPEVRHTASRAARSALPVGIVESLDQGPNYASRERAGERSHAAKVAAQIVAQQQIRT